MLGGTWLIFQFRKTIIFIHLYSLLSLYAAFLISILYFAIGFLMRSIIISPKCSASLSSESALYVLQVEGGKLQQYICFIFSSTVQFSIFSCIIDLIKWCSSIVFSFYKDIFFWSIIILQETWTMYSYVWLTIVNVVYLILLTLVHWWTYPVIWSSKQPNSTSRDIAFFIPSVQLREIRFPHPAFFLCADNLKLNLFSRPSNFISCHARTWLPYSKHSISQMFSQLKWKHRAVLIDTLLLLLLLHLLLLCLRPVRHTYQLGQLGLV